jgi:hypothetical protein
MGKLDGKVALVTGVRSFARTWTTDLKGRRIRSNSRAKWICHKTRGCDVSNARAEFFGKEMNDDDENNHRWQL